MHVDGPAAEVVATGQRQRDPAETAQQWTQHVDAGADAFHQFVRRDRRDVPAVDEPQRSRFQHFAGHTDRCQQVGHEAGQPGEVIDLRTDLLLALGTQ